MHDDAFDGVRVIVYHRLSAFWRAVQAAEQMRDEAQPAGAEDPPQCGRCGHSCSHCSSGAHSGEEDIDSLLLAQHGSDRRAYIMALMRRALDVLQQRSLELFGVQAIEYRDHARVKDDHRRPELGLALQAIESSPPGGIFLAAWLLRIGRRSADTASKFQLHGLGLRRFGERVHAAGWNVVTLCGIDTRAEGGWADYWRRAAETVANAAVAGRNTQLNWRMRSAAGFTKPYPEHRTSAASSSISVPSDCTLGSSIYDPMRYMTQYDARHGTPKAPGQAARLSAALKREHPQLVTKPELTASGRWAQRCGHCGASCPPSGSISYPAATAAFSKHSGECGPRLARLAQLNVSLVPRATAAFVQQLISQGKLPAQPTHPSVLVQLTHADSATRQ